MLHWLFSHKVPATIPAGDRPVEYGVVKVPICPYRGGSIEYQGHWYRAKSSLSNTIPCGQLVMVVADRGSYLEVVPLADVAIAAESCL